MAGERGTHWMTRCEVRGVLAGLDHCQLVEDWGGGGGYSLKEMRRASLSPGVRREGGILTVGVRSEWDILQVGVKERR